MALTEKEKINLRKMQRLAGECTLFLKRNGDFPLEKPGEIALYGSGARHTIRGGTGSGEVNTRVSITAERGLIKEGFTIKTADWLDAYDNILESAENQFYKDIKRQAAKNHKLAVFEGMGKIMPEPEYTLPVEKECETAIYVLSRISGEGSDREAKKGQVLLSDTEIKDILLINKKYDKFMLVLNTGGPVDLTPVEEVSNILLLSQLGSVTGKTLARILLGKDYPSGKLATTWAKWNEYCSEGSFGDKNDTYYNEGIYVGYRFFDSVGKRADYSFGYGLGYTSFAVNAESVSLDKAKVSVKAAVENTGSFKGKEVVQVYVSVPAGKLDQPAKTLAAFVKTSELLPGEKTVVETSFDITELAGYDTETESYILEAGDYVVRVGNSSVDTQPAAVIKLDKTVTTIKAKNCLGDCGFEDYKPAMPADTEKLSGVKTIKLSASSIEATEVSYDNQYEIDPAVDAMTDEQLAALSVGGFDPNGGPASVIGNAGMRVAGAAGETANPFNDKDFPVLVLADGPAGVRISKKYTLDEKGMAHPVGIGLPNSMLKLMPAPAVAFLKLKASRAKKNGEVLTHYATAIPIGTALAQSFNVDLAKECGDVVGDEMERFGVHLWLAPALNIHRSICCGRNFEYFSEDPLVSGKIAAALTNGVQAHKGCGTTIKHYAANNQETNRYNSNSHVSERALREIYLKGFGICVRESQPFAVMTSYNLLNGEHTSESRALIEDILRSEYGFKGLVMTDWIVPAMMDKTSLHRGPEVKLIPAAGGDLIMPGGPADVEAVLMAITSGELSREQVKINVSRTYRLAKQCNER